MQQLKLGRGQFAMMLRMRMYVTATGHFCISQLQCGQALSAMQTHTEVCMLSLAFAPVSIMIT